MQMILVAFLDRGGDRTRGIVAEPGDFAFLVPDDPGFPMDVERLLADVRFDPPEGIGQEPLLIGLHLPGRGGTVRQPAHFVAGLRQPGHVPGMVFQHLERMVFPYRGILIEPRMMGPDDVHEFGIAPDIRIVAHAIGDMLEGDPFSYGPVLDSSLARPLVLPLLLFRPQGDAAERRRFLFDRRRRKVLRRIGIGLRARDRLPLGLDFRARGRIGRKTARKGIRTLQAGAFWLSPSLGSG